VILGISILSGVIYLSLKLKLKIKWFIIPTIMVSFITVIVTDLSLKGSKIFIVNPDLSLKTKIVFSNQAFTLSNGNTIQIVVNYDSYVINNSTANFFVEELIYGVSNSDKIEDPLVESYSLSKVPFRRLSYYGKNENPIESISVGRGSSGDTRYWLREANSKDVL